MGQLPHQVSQFATGIVIPYLLNNMSKCGSWDSLFVCLLTVIQHAPRCPSSNLSSVPAWSHITHLIKKLRVHMRHGQTSQVLLYILILNCTHIIPSRLWVTHYFTVAVFHCGFNLNKPISALSYTMKVSILHNRFTLAPQYKLLHVYSLCLHHLYKYIGYVSGVFIPRYTKVLL